MREFIQIAAAFSQQLREMTLPDDLAGAIARLSQTGYEILGTPGRYGTVMQKPGATYCLKLFSSNDKAYLSYLRLVQTTPNEHFPKLVGKPVPIKRKADTDDLAQLRRMTFNDETGYPLYYAIRMERLDSRLGDAFDWSETMNAYVHGDPSLARTHPTLAVAIDLILRHTTYRQLDLAPRNILFRGAVPVLTDPVV